MRRLNLEFFEVHCWVSVRHLSNWGAWIGFASVPQRRQFVIFFIDRANVAECVIIITIQVRILIRWNVANTLDITINDATMVPSRVVVPSSCLTLQICPWLPSVFILQELRV